MTDIFGRISKYFTKKTDVLAHQPSSFPLELRRSISHAIAASGKSRVEIAAHMSEILGAKINTYHLDAWTAESRPAWRFPFEYAAAFELACQTDALRRLLKRYSGEKVMLAHEILKAQLFSLDLLEAEIRTQKSYLRRHMNIFVLGKEARAHLETESPATIAEGPPLASLPLENG